MVVDYAHAFQGEPAVPTNDMRLHLTRFYLVGRNIRRKGDAACLGEESF